MKKFLAVLCVITAIILVPPFIIGSKVESSLGQWLELVSDDEMLFTVESFEQGYFSSRAVVLMTPNIGLPDVDGQTLPFELDIHHGPLILSNGFHIAAMQVQAVVRSEDLPRKEIWKSESALNYSAIVGFDGGAMHQLKLGVIDYNDGITLVFDGLKAEAITNAQLTSLTADIGLGKIVVSTYDELEKAYEKIELSSSQMSMSWQQESSLQDLHFGKNQWHIPLLMMGDKVSKIKAQGLVVSNEIRMNSDQAIGFYHELSGDIVEGTYDVENINYKMSFDNIQLETYKAFLDFSDHVSDLQASNESMTAERLDALMRPLFQNGIHHQQSLQAEVFSTPMKANFKAEFVGDETSYDAYLSQDPIVFLSDFKAGFKADADKKPFLASPLAKLLDEWVKKGVIAMGQDKAQIDISLENGFINMNGIRLPLAMLLNEPAQ